MQTDNLFLSFNLAISGVYSNDSAKLKTEQAGETQSK